MSDVSTADVQRNFETYRKQAETETVMVLCESKPSVVIMSAAEYDRLKRREKQAVLTEDLPEWIIDRVAAGEGDAEEASAGPSSDREKARRAAAGLREASRGATLGGSSIRDIVDEGRS